MKNPSAVCSVTNIKDTGLLHTIREVLSQIGDGPNDGELNCLLRDTLLPVEAGFTFLSYSEGSVMLKVPRQDLAVWYPNKCWISPEKEARAKAVAEKYALSLCEPPDILHHFSDALNCHHHLELGNGRETMIVIHSQYLKVRLFFGTGDVRSSRVVQKPVIFDQDLLQDLSALY